MNSYVTRSAFHRAWVVAIVLLLVPPAFAETSVRIGELKLDLISPSAFSYQDGLSFNLVGSSEAGVAEATVTPVNVALGLGNGSVSGCNAADFAGFPAGNIALVQRGGCPFALKANNAAAAGASAVLLFNQGNTSANLGLILATMGVDYTGGIPVYFLTYGLGEALVNTTNPVMRVEAPVFRGTRQEAYLQYCLANRSHCALAVRHINEGWTRTLNGNRLQVTASTFKILSLIAYAEAVVAGDINPNTVVPRDDWARFSVRRDGGALQNAWERLGQPTSITIDQMMSVMLRESDNAAPDWLLAELGRPAMEDVVRRYVDGFHDVPQSINAYFTSIDGSPLEADPAPRLLSTYEGYQDAGYRAEVESVFAQMRADPTLGQQVRDYTCQAVPWSSPPPACVPGWTTNSAQYRELLGRFHLRTNVNTYLRLMEGLLEGTLVTPQVYAVMEPHLEFFMTLPGFSDFYTRYGGKGGSFGPQNVCNWTGFAEGVNGEKILVATMVRDSLQSCGYGIFPTTFMQQLVTDSVFRERVRDEPLFDSDVFYGGFEGAPTGAPLGR